MAHALMRRTFLKQGALAAGAALSSRFAAVQRLSAETPRSVMPDFPATDPLWRATWNAALALLARNVRMLPRYDKPVLVEGSTYAGIWQECAPQEGLVYGNLQRYIDTPSGSVAPLQIARANHMAFFAQQKPDGQLPASIKLADLPGSTNGYGQIQMVVPIAATAWELAQLTQDEELLETAYRSCSRWDAWLRRYRNTRRTGLVEGFCTYDTGQDNSPRWAGIPNRCPDADARRCPADRTLPRLCPDLSAAAFGARIALAAMAREMGRNSDHARWLADAEHIRQLILSKLYSPEDAAFYDLDAQNKFVRIRGDAMVRVLGEHVVDPVNDRHIFESVWNKQIHNPSAFWAPYPLPSIALDDPRFVRPIPRNSWGGASQALTALRAPRWMAYYGKDAELKQLMKQWCEAILRHMEFRQQIDPLTGGFTQDDPGGYSPAALVFLEFAQRLYT